MVRITGIDVVKGGIKLFRNFNWTIQPHEHWVINGVNGSGKTILLEVLAGLRHATHGEIQYSFVDGKTWDDRYAQRKQHIHYVPAHAAQTFLSDQEIFYQQRYYSIGDERVPRVRELLGNSVYELHKFNFPSSFSIDELLDLPVTRLSNGQLKKVLILKNLALSIPRMLLLDYPLRDLIAKAGRSSFTFSNILLHITAFNWSLLIMSITFQ